MAVNRAFDEENGPITHLLPKCLLTLSHLEHSALLLLSLGVSFITPVHTVASTCSKFCCICPKCLLCKDEISIMNDQPQLPQFHLSGSAAFKSCSKWGLSGSSPAVRNVCMLLRDVSSPLKASLNDLLGPSTTTCTAVCQVSVGHGRSWPATS